MRKVQSTCNFCAIDCNLDFYVEDGRIVKTVPTKGYPVNNGFSCIKGLSLSKQQTTVKPNALPKIRQSDGSFQEVSWDQAFTHVADKIRELQDKYGRESVAGISTGQLTLEEFARLTVMTLPAIPWMISKSRTPSFLSGPTLLWPIPSSGRESGIIPFRTGRSSCSIPEDPRLPGTRIIIIPSAGDPTLP